jgi:hypothetical protein
MLRRSGKIVEGRFAHAQNDEFFLIEVLCGTYEEAQSAATLYMCNHRMPGGNLIWREGGPDSHGPVFYASTPEITFRVRQ